MSQQGIRSAPVFEGSVEPAFPLALLESVRAHDHPGEVLEDENLSVSLPRRLGLTGVVETQIMRYRKEQREGRMVRLDEVLSLVRLVLRRPDADPILRETGQRIARWRSRRMSRVYTSVLHRAPNRLGMRAVRRQARRALRALRVGARIEVAKPFTIRIDNAVTALVDSGSPGCSIVTGLLQEQILLFTGRAATVQHEQCGASGSGPCIWSMVADAPEESTAGAAAEPESRQD